MRRASFPKAKTRHPEPRSAVTYLPRAAIKPYAANPRKHPRDQVAAIARSIEAFGFTAPILVDKDNNIVAGHGRHLAAELLDLAEVPVIRLERLTPEQVKAYRLADNKLADRSSWDDRQVALDLKELSELADEIVIEATGFEAAEIDIRIQSLDEPEVADPADGFEALEGPPTSRLGDVWALGDHRLVCGSALEPASYSALAGKEAAAAVFTDPPYNVPVNGHVSGKGARKHREFPEASGEMSKEEFLRFLVGALRLAVAHAQDEATFFACMDWRHMAVLDAVIGDIECEALNLCVWVKTNGGMGSLYRSRHELVFVFGRRGAKRVNNVQLGKFGRNRTNVWNYPGMNAFARRGRTRGLDHHPTVKPIAMVRDAILDVTAHGDLVLDPFVGSGTTLLAAERTGRRCYAIELDPHYVDTAIARWEAMSGQRATLADGRTFEEVRAQRQHEREGEREGEGEGEGGGS